MDEDRADTVKGGIILMDLTCYLPQLQLEHPIMPAAGPPVGDGRRGLLARQGGAAALVTKTISRKKATVPRPYLAQQGAGMLNAELWSELSPGEWLEEEMPRLQELDCPLIISVGYQQDDMEFLIPRFHPYAQAFELSTHYLGGDLTPMVAAIKTARKLTHRPLFLKISPGVNLPQVVQAAESAGADALVLINSLGPCFDFHLPSNSPLLGSRDGCGYLSGPALFPLALGAVLQAAQLSSLPLIGVGGISTGEDVVKMIMAGASAVQVCTQVILEGPSTYRRLVEETSKVLETLPASSLKQVQGRILQEIPPKRSWKIPPPKVEESICTGCQRCFFSCTAQAIYQKGDKVAIKGDRCQRCGLCWSRCLKKAITWEGRA